MFCLFGMTKLFFGITNLKITFGMTNPRFGMIPCTRLAFIQVYFKNNELFIICEQQIYVLLSQINIAHLRVSQIRTISKDPTQDCCNSFRNVSTIVSMFTIDANSHVQSDKNNTTIYPHSFIAYFGHFYIVYDQV